MHKLSPENGGSLKSQKTEFERGSRKFDNSFDQNNMNILNFNAFKGLNNHFFPSLPAPDINEAEFLNFSHLS